MEDKRYQFYTNGINEVIVVSHFAGKSVRGVAKCCPHDTFDYETGKKIAKARCDLKIAQKRAHLAEARADEALKKANDAINYCERMKEYLLDACDAYANATAELGELLENS